LENFLNVIVMLKHPKNKKQSAPNALNAPRNENVRKSNHNNLDV
jgi:hypothetical protein